MDRRHGFPQTWQEARRKRAFELTPHRWKPCEIAEALGVSPAAVSQWLAHMREHGVAAWRAKPGPTGPINLTGDQWRLIPELLSHGAEAYGFRGECWPCARVARVIGEEFGVWYHKAHVSRLLKRLHWTPQMPIARAIQRDEAVIEPWRLQVWPQLKKVHVEGRTIVCADESGFSLWPGHFRTYAPCGQTPILRWPYTRDHLSVMSGITMVRDEALDSLDRVVFLKHLLLHVSDKCLVVWDSSPMHTGQVRTYLVDGGAPQMHVEQLPPYAPDLNPSEGVWHQLKHVEMRHLCCRNLAHLRSE
jgi:transposase